MSISNFTFEGLPIGAGDRNMTYLYGVSDFWSTIFEDTDKVNLFYEASSQRLSEIYSHFLQLCSTISLEDIQVYSSKQLKLVLLGDSNAVAGKVNTYTLPSEILSSESIANRPLLPTVYLESGVHFSISSDGKEISFSTSLNSLGFPARILSTGEKQYALWFVDAKIDEQFIYKYFGRIILPTAPDKSTEAYKNFIYGLYYLFINGPDLSNLKKGLNIALGIPLARDTETVLETRKYLNTDQYIVVTDTNSYLIPYGLTPTVSAGDVLQPTQELAEWVEVKDYRTDGEWWINLQIPPSIMPYIPPGEPDRYAKAGSYADYVMRNYLKKHTFLVNVKTIDFKNLQTFEQLFDIIKDAKPSYTTPLYIWTVPTVDEVMTLDDSTISQIRSQFKCENLSRPINKMDRKLVRYATIASGSSGANLVGNSVTWDSGWQGVKADLPLTSGRWYWEITNSPRFAVDYNNWANLPAFSINVGIGQDSSATVGNFSASSGGYSWYSYKGNYGNSRPDASLYLSMGGASFSIIRADGVDINTNYGVAPGADDVIGVLFDADTRQLSFYVNGVSMGVACTVNPGVYYPMVGSWDGNVATSINFGEREFAYPPADPTINLGVYSFRYGRQYPDFSYDKYSGVAVNSSNRTITGTVPFFVTARAGLGTLIPNPIMAKSSGVYWSEFTFSTTDPSQYSAWGVGIGRGTDSTTQVVGLYNPSASLLTVNSGVTGILSHFSGFKGSFTFINGVLTPYWLPDSRALTTGDVLGVLVDASIGKISFYKNGVDTGLGATLGAGPWYLEISVFLSTTVNYNCGEAPFKYPPPGRAVPGWFADNSYDDRLTRGCPQFIRSNSSWKIYGQLGNGSENNGAPRSFDSGVISGYVGSDNQYQSGKELQVNEWISAVMTRDSEIFGKTRSTISFNRGALPYRNSVQTFTKGNGLLRKVFLYNTTQAELSSRLGTLGQTIPDSSTWEWTLFETQRVVGELINAQPIDTSRVTSYYNYITTNFSTIFFRTGKPYLGNFMPVDSGYETYAPNVSDIQDGDFLWFVRIMDNTIGVFWMTSNLAVSAPNTRPVLTGDETTIGMRNIPLRRGDGMYSPYYNVRGGGTNSVGNSLAIDSQPINSSIDSGSKISVYYVDDTNPTPVPIDRSGVVFNMRKQV